MPQIRKCVGIRLIAQGFGVTVFEFLYFSQKMLARKMLIIRVHEIFFLPEINPGLVIKWLRLPTDTDCWFSKEEKKVATVYQKLRNFLRQN